MLNKIKLVIENNTTYRIGLLQSKAQRILHECTTKYLKNLKISPINWAFLGIVNDHEDGIRPSEAAEILGVEAPFITSMINDLRKKGLIADKSHPEDNRVKMVQLTQKGRKFVESTESQLRTQMKVLVKDISPKEFADYLYVLKKIIDNSEIK